MLRFLQREVFRSLKSISISKASVTTTSDPSFTAYFLINSCGLSRDAAIAAASKLQFKTTKTPHSVLALLRSYGFSKPHITSLISRRPNLLLANPEKTIKPKLDFFLSVGFSDLPTLLSSSPNLLLWSLENRMIPNLNLLKTLLGTDADVTAAVKKSRCLLISDLRKVLLPRLEFLKQNEVSMPVILKLITMHPRCLLKSSNWFTGSITTIKAMGINPSSSIFAHALGVLDKLPKIVWERKLGTYSALGWSKEDIISAFAKHPYCMSVSDEKITANVEFIRGTLGWETVYLVKNPVVISLSLEKRIVPRCAVLGVLVSKKLLKLKGGVRARHLMMSQTRFMEAFVNKFQSEAPEVLDAIHGKVQFTGFLEIQD
ncbi:hypothetical protein J5N97_013540 [Dioscorea zingiberensis]|uniref:Uncharacterized protein n=1 Tax=Dioscorea zingiberensis TaxID=325984 RepID=A0A9D5CQS0_9LILI|nr:hypothetical protein J5N97_013540 [Dioscorea zingiberensis]